MGPARHHLRLVCLVGTLLAMDFTMILFILGAALGAIAMFAWITFHAEAVISEVHHDYQQQITDLLKRIRRLEKP